MFSWLIRLSVTSQDDVHLVDMTFTSQWFVQLANTTVKSQGDTSVTSHDDVQLADSYDGVQLAADSHGDVQLADMTVTSQGHV